MEPPEVGPNPGYADDQLDRALRTLIAHPDPAVRERALARAARWRDVADGLASGSLRVGTRQPVDAPVWATPEVVHGGFATGALLAERPVGDDERDVASLAPAGGTERGRVNRGWLSDPGLEHLRDALRTGAYRVDRPEQGALLVVAWLIDRDPLGAVDLIDELLPWFDRLQLGPTLVARPGPVGAAVHVATAGEVAERLRRWRRNAKIDAMNATLGPWNALYDELVALWCDTVVGELPTLVAGRPVGGWPGTRWPADFTARRDAWRRARAAASTGRPPGRHGHRKGNFQRLEAALADAPDALTFRSRASVRLALANTVSRWGPPGSAARSTARALQAQVAQRPTFHRLSGVVLRRVAAQDADGGIADLDVVLAPVEASEDAGAAGVTIPEAIARRVRRALDAPVADLVAAGVIPSAEVLARVLPQISGQVAAAGLSDDAIRELFARIYASFRRRRSLLLLRLEHQVQLDELPWVRALGPHRAARPDGVATARATVEQVVRVTLAAFPEARLPNPLLREIGALVTASSLSLPIVEEVAADLFMGVFTTKWEAAGRAASALLEGTIYARYFDMPSVEDWGPPDPSPPAQWGVPTSAVFGRLCERRAEAAGGRGYGLARAHAILEQAEILTTHNLALLVDGLGLRAAVAADAPELAARALAWAMTRRPAPDPASTRQAIKAAATAFRQGLYFLSLVPEDRQADVVRDAEARIARGRTPWTRRLRPAWEALAEILAGRRFDPSGRVGASGRRLLGGGEGARWVLERPA